MRGGQTFLIGSAVLALAGCSSGPGQVEVRALADPAAKLGAGSERLAEARGQLVLGNVGLAIEGYRAALREQPDSVEAMRGLAAAYDAMGRTDLSRQYYEAALAVAPHDAKSLNAFAASLEGQGSRTQAAQLRSEAAQASAKPAAAVVAMAAPVPPVAPVVTASAGQSVTIALPPPRPASTPKAQPIARAAVQFDGPRLQRLSLGEVALLTAGEPAWQSMVTARTTRSTTVHWVALNDSNTRPNIRLLNAARTQGLAARTRDYLLALGWRKIEIGDADEVRDSTVVMYPAGRQSTGRSLAAQFGVRAGTVQQGQMLVVLLGRDAAASRIAQSRG
jgi:tetratricopeptide (TPR) repeat protein